MTAQFFWGLGNFFSERMVFFLQLFCVVGALRVAVLSDVHLNLNTESSCMEGHPSSGNGAQLFCDSTAALVASALVQLAAMEACPAALVIPGDVLRHSYSKAMTAQEGLLTYSTLMTLIRAAYGSSCLSVLTPMVAIGNNDLLQRYPAPGTSSAWLSQLVDSWPVLKSLSAAEKLVFEQTGCYTRDVVGLGVRMIVFQTNYWSSQNSNTGSTIDPGGLLQWLQDQLQRAKDSGVKVCFFFFFFLFWFFVTLSLVIQVWLLGHIAPGVDHYSKRETWHVQLANRYYAIVRPFFNDGLIAAALFGHEHAIIERRAADGVEELALLSGSLSPDKVLVFYSKTENWQQSQGNYPTVRLLYVDDVTKKVTDLVDWMLPLDPTSNPPWNMLGDGTFNSQWEQKKREREWDRFVFKLTKQIIDTLLVLFLMWVCWERRLITMECLQGYCCSLKKTKTDF
jgi:hypothetical protein